MSTAQLFDSRRNPVKILRDAEIISFIIGNSSEPLNDKMDKFADADGNYIAFYKDEYNEAIATGTYIPDVADQRPN
jgi:hypothetical protein